MPTTDCIDCSKQPGRCRCNCNDVITLWDCLFGDDRWKDLYRRRRDVWLEECKNRRTNTGKELKKPVLLTKNTTQITKKERKTTKKQKTICREVYSVEIEPTNLMRYLMPWKKKNPEMTAEDDDNMKNKQDEKRLDKSGYEKMPKQIVQRRIRQEEAVVLIGNANDDDLKVKFPRKIRTETVRRRRFEGEVTKRKSVEMINENKKDSSCCIQTSNSKSPSKKKQSTTLIAEQLTNLSQKIDKLENSIRALKVRRQENLNKTGAGDRNRITKMRASDTKNGRLISQVCSDTKMGRNVVKNPKSYTIQRSESNPSLLRIHAPMYSDCGKTNQDACILIHTQKRDVCVHGSYLDVDKQDQTLWDQIRNMFSVFAIGQVFYRDNNSVLNKKKEVSDCYCDANMIDKKKQDGEYSGTNITGQNNDSSTEDEYQSLDGDNLNDLSVNGESKSCTVMKTNSKELDNDENRDKTLEIDMDEDTVGILTTTSKIFDSYCRNGEKSVENCKETDSDLFYNMLGDIYSSNKYGLFNECNLNDFGESNSYQSKNYLINEHRQTDGNTNSAWRMKLSNKERYEQEKDKVLVKKEDEISLEAATETEVPHNGFIKYSKIVESNFQDPTKKYEESLRKTLKTENAKKLNKLPFMNQFTSDDSSFFQFPHNEIDDLIFPPNLAGVRIYQVYESEETRVSSNL